MNRKSKAGRKAPSKSANTRAQRRTSALPDDALGNVAGGDKKKTSTRPDHSEIVVTKSTDMASTNLF